MFANTDDVVYLSIAVWTPGKVSLLERPALVRSLHSVALEGDSARDARWKRVAHSRLATLVSSCAHAQVR